MSAQDDISIKKYNSFNILPWFICGMGALFYCYEFFLRVAPSVMAGDMMRFYKIGASDFAILTAFYSYAYTPMQIVVGVLMDHFGPRRLLCLSILACVFGALLISSYPELIVGKMGFFAMGFGSSFAFVGVLKLAVNWLPHNRLSFVAGVTTTLGLLGAIYAQSMLSFTLEIVNWRYSWYYAGLAGLVIYLITLLTVRDHPKDKLPDVENVPEANWRELFIDLISIFKNYKFIINGFIGCVLYLPISVFAGLWAIPFFVQGANLAPKTAANLVPLVFLGMAISGPIAGLLSEYFGCRKIFYYLSLICSLAIFLIIIYLPHLPIFMLGILLLLLGLVSGSQILVFAIGIELTAKEASGTATACTNFLVMIGGMILSPIFGFLLEKKWDGTIVNGVPYYSLESYQLALLLVIGCYTAAFLLSFLLSETHPAAVARKLAKSEKLMVLE